MSGSIPVLDMAVALRQPPKGCIHHTDRGSQYCSHDYQKHLLDNAWSKRSSNLSLAPNAGIRLSCKAELPWRNRWETRRQVGELYSDFSTAFITRGASIHRWVVIVQYFSLGRPNGSRSFLPRQGQRKGHQKISISLARDANAFVTR